MEPTLNRMPMGLAVPQKRFDESRLWHTALQDDEVATEELIRCLDRKGRRLDLAGVPAGPARDAVDDLLIQKEPGQWVRIEPGSYMMGSPEGEPGRWPDEHQQEATVPRPFLLGTAPVTQREWRKVMDTDPSHFKGEDLPVEMVSWLDAVAFCNARSRRDGLPECYQIDGDRVEWVRCGGWRLPTEVEWEYAARAGTTGARYGELDEIAWWADNSGGTTHPVREKKPNAWGLYDMIGNVWEWCWDRYAPAAADAVLYPDEEAGALPFGLARSGSAAVAAGAATPRAAGRRTAAAARRRSATTTSASASPDEEAGSGPFGQARTGSAAVAAGTATPGAAGRRAAATRRRTAAAPSASASPDEESGTVPFGQGRAGSTAVSVDRQPATPSRRRTATAASASASPDEEVGQDPFVEARGGGSSSVAAGVAPSGSAARRSAATESCRAASTSSASGSPDEEAGPDPFGRTGSFAVAAGAASPSSAGRRSATASRRRTASAASASASPDEEVGQDPFVEAGVRAVVRGFSYKSDGFSALLGGRGYAGYEYPYKDIGFRLAR